MVSRQHAAYDVNAHFVTGLPDDLPDTFTHRTLKNRVAVFRDPNDMEPVVKSRVRGLRVAHNLSS